ncbi:DUF3450 domain-containing protein [Ferrimonas sp. SCSIO 43195]|uniref:DUF3450 domain-containing protein n=1 Tax=Ferrimonas sp. SCSIO 43195 TaxID=2822844 RepID=UPI0020751EDF|nr:DUF3450 domain-containing protein [Ferrimonas sp. SCSIO 43195]USD39465.1 DUF3450 domain-containing protein [Ferrimonas sp. SCSIO 43195]
MLMTLLFCASTSLSVNDLTQPLTAPIERASTLGKKARLWQQEQAAQYSEQQEALAQIYWTEFQIEKLQRQIAQQQRQIDALNDDLANIAAIARQLEPSLEVWYARLEQQIHDDLPFLTEERQRRLALFRQSLDNADVSQAERFRHLMEVIQIEVEQGYGTVVAQQRIVIDGQSRQVQSFRLGRLLWLAQTADGTLNAYFDPARAQWQPLDDRYRQAIRSAIAISQNQQRAELLPLPLPGGRS